MCTVLYIKANPKSDEKSNTFNISNQFIEAYSEKNPDDTIISLDLCKEEITPLTEEMVFNMFQNENSIVKVYAEQFAKADKYVIAAPMWNLSFPAILKCYIDYIVYKDITFKYTEKGAVGLLSDQDKKVVHIVTRGGFYTDGNLVNYEFGDKYLKGILGFLGIHDVETIVLEGTNVLSEEELEKERAKVLNRAKELAQKF